MELARRGGYAHEEAMADHQRRSTIADHSGPSVTRTGERLRALYLTRNQVWRPIATIRKDPIAVMDANSIADSDLIGAALQYPTHNGETWAVRPNPAHKWYFKRNLSPAEVLLIKCFDSNTSVARRVPHSAFEDADEKDQDSLQSVEVRCLVFHDI